MDEFYIEDLGDKLGCETTKTLVLIARSFDFVTDQESKLN